MQTVEWISGSGGNWSMGQDWSDALVPTSETDVVIDAPPSNAVGYTVYVNGKFTADSLALIAAATVHVNSYQSLTLSAGTGGGANAGTIAIGNGALLSLAGVFDNAGLLSIQGGKAVTSLQIGAASVTLSGDGTVALTDAGGDSQIGATAAGDALVNISNTIVGAGVIGAGGLAFDNQLDGVIDATGADRLMLDPSGKFSNEGVLEATAGGGLEIAGATLANSGSVLADGASVYLDNATIDGGTLGGVASSIVVEDGTTFLNGVTVDVGTTLMTASGGTLEIDGSSQTYGSFTNSGTINAGGVLMATQTTFINSPTGLVEATGPAALTIEGSYSIGSEATSVLNDGTIASLNPGSSTVGGVIITDAYIYSSPATTEGLIEAVGAGAQVDLQTNVAIGGGTLFTSGAGVIDVGSEVANGETSTVLFDPTEAITLAGVLNIQINSLLYLENTLVNDGTITITGDPTLQPGQAATLFAGVETAATLDGGGQIELATPGDSQNSGDAQIIGVGLVNINNTISGSGVISSGGNIPNPHFIFDNQAAGVVDATLAGGILIYDVQMTNEGLIEASNADLQIVAGTTIVNSGTLSANGGTISLSDGTVMGGTLGGGWFAVDSGNGGNTGTLSDVTMLNDSYLTIDSNATLTLSGTIYDPCDIFNSGTMVATGSADIEGGTAISGGAFGGSSGTFVLTDGTTNLSDVSIDVGATLMTVNGGAIVIGPGLVNSGTIDAGGQLESDGLINTNTPTGIIESSGTLALTIDLGYGVGPAALDNLGIIASVDPGAGPVSGLIITDTTVFDGSGNSTGTIEAIGAGAHVDLQVADEVEGGTLLTSGGGVINVVSSNSLSDNSAGLIGTLDPVTLAGSLAIQNGATLVLMGCLINEGTVSIVGIPGTNANGYAQLFGVTATLMGGGQVELVAPDNSDILGYGDIGGTSFVNINNIIFGGGGIGGSGLSNGILSFGNQAAGTIDSTAPGGIYFYDINLSNAGLIEATSGGSSYGLQIGLGATIINTGTIFAAAGCVVSLVGGTIIGGILSAPDAAFVDEYRESTLSGVTLTSGSVVVVNSTLNLIGTISNSGTMIINAGGSLLASGASVTLTGGGSVTLDSVGQTGAIATGSALVNINNIIDGGGTIGSGLALDNRAQGIIDANQTYGTLVLGSTGTTFSNEGLIEATSTLQIDAGTFDNTGTLQVLDGGIATITAAVAIANVSGSTLTGGTWGATATVPGHTGTLAIAGGVGLVTDAADIVLSGAGSSMTVAGTAIEASLTSVAAEGALQLLGGRGYNSANMLSDSGSIVLAGGTLATGGLTLASSGILTGSGTVTSTVANAGTITAQGGTLLLDLGVTGSGGLQVAAGATLELAAVTVAGTVANSGVLRLDGSTLAATIVTLAAGTLVGSGTVLPGIADAGQIEASGGDLVIDGKVTGSGRVLADAGATLDLAGNAAFTTVQSNVTLFGAGSVIDTGSGTTLRSLETTLTSIRAGATLAVLGNRGFAASRALTNAGLLQLGGGTLSAASFTLSTTGKLVGNGTVAVAVAGLGTIASQDGLLRLAGGVDGSGVLLAEAGSTLELASSGTTGQVTVVGTLQLDGTALSAIGVTLDASGVLVGSGTVAGLMSDGGKVEANGGLLKLTEAVSGVGSLQIDAGSTLELEAATGDRITFAAATGTLQLDMPGAVAAGIAGFAGSDVIGLSGEAATGLNYDTATHTLTVTGVSGPIATLRFIGTYTQADFQLAANGTEIIDPAAAVTAQTIGTAAANFLAPITAPLPPSAWWPDIVATPPLPPSWSGTAMLPQEHGGGSGFTAAEAAQLTGGQPTSHGHAGF